MPAEESPRLGWVADAAWPPRSGIGNHAYQLIRSLNSLAGPVRLIHLGRRPPLFEPPSPETVLPRWMGWRFLKRLAPALHPGVRELDVIHFPTEFDLWYLRPGKAARVVTIHGCAPALLPPSLHRPIGEGLRRRLSRALREVEAVVTVSLSSAAEIEEVYGLPRSGIRVVPNGVSRAFFAAAPAPEAWYRERFGLEGEYLLAVGLMIPKKNQAAALRAWRRLEDRGRRLSFVLVGGGPLEGELRRAAAELGLAGRFVVTGFLDEEALARLYARAACLLFPSFHEGFGMPVAEAMAAGCPVVASDIPALREVTGGAAPLLDPADDEGMAREALRLIEDAALRREAVERARVRAAAFSWDASALRLLEIYREAAAARGAPGPGPARP